MESNVLSESVKTIKAQLYERATSPLISVFMISWCIWNYRLIMVVFSDSSVMEKFNLIDNSLFNTLLACSTRGALYPLLTTAFMIFVYPYPAKFVYEFWRKRQKELKEIRQLIEDETPLTKEEAKVIRKDVIKLELEYETELKKKNDDIKRLKEIIEEANNNKVDSDIKSTISSADANNKINKLDDTVKLNYLKMVANSNQPTISRLINASADDKIKTQYVLDELVNMKLLIYAYHEDAEEYAYSLTHTGRELIVNNTEI